MLASGAAVSAINAFAAAAHPIVLEVDLSVDPAREREMLSNFNNIFKPAAVKYPGYIDVKLLKLRSALMGSAPEGLNYRFVLVYQSEEMRQKWVASDVHQRVWPTLENTLKSKEYRVLLFDEA
jgi:heme-degrading monooxygenase HmoA